MDIDSSYIAPKVGDRVRVVMEGRVNWAGTMPSEFELNGVYGIDATGSQVVSVEILAPVEPPNGTHVELIEA